MHETDDNISFISSRKLLLGETSVKGFCAAMVQPVTMCVGVVNGEIKIWVHPGADYVHRSFLQVSYIPLSTAQEICAPPLLIHLPPCVSWPRRPILSGSSFSWASATEAGQVKAVSLRMGQCGLPLRWTSSPGPGTREHVCMLKVS